MKNIKPHKIKLRRGDQVLVIAGKNKGEKGRILQVDRQNNRVIVENINMVTKHLKPGRQSQTGGIVKKEASVHASNVMLLHKGEPTRIGYRIEESDGYKNKIRIAKSTGEVID